MSAKDAVKAAIATLWDAAARLGPRQPKLTILYYHAVRPQFAANFEAQMAYLKAHANILEPDHSGPLDATRPNVAVVFDDAFRSVREHALPALERHRVRATIYVPSGWLGQPPGWDMETYADREETVMSAQELRDLPRELIGFGSHTVHHPHLPRLSVEELKEELGASRKQLEDHLGAAIDTLAFPYGEYDDRAVAIAEEVGYRVLYTVDPQPIRGGHSQALRGRTAAEPWDTIGLFAIKSRGGYDWMPMASRLKRAIRPRL